MADTNVTRADLQKFADEVSQTLATVVNALTGALDDAVAIVKEATDIDYEAHPEPTEAQLMFASAGTAVDLALTGVKHTLLQRLEEASKR